MKIKLDPNALTFGDLEDFEERTGESLMDTFGKVGADGGVSGLKLKTVLGLLWVCHRQENPDFTWDDARKAKITELEVEVAGEPDPTSGDG